MDLLCLLLWLLFALSLLLVLRFIVKPRPGKLPPGPMPFPVIGNLLELGDKPHKSLAELDKTHGPIMSLKLGQATTIVISSATLAKEVMKKHDVVLSSRTIPDSVRAHKHDQLGMPWLPVSPAWRNLRKICNSQLFTTQKLDASQDLRFRKVQELVANVRESSQLGVAVEIGQLAYRTSLNLLSNTVFSVDLAGDHDSNSAREFKRHVEAIMEEAGKPNLADYFPILRKIDPQGARRRMSFHMGKVFRIFGGLIDERMRIKKTQKSKSFNDMLDALLDIEMDEKEDSVSLRTFVEHLALDLFVAGTDTSSNTVEWAMAELIRNPDKLQKAQSELEKMIGRENPVRESDIAKLPYLQSVVKETLRLHPPVPLLLPRKADQDAEIYGFLVPRGAQVLVNAWAIGRDRTIWENPERFEPERFVGSEIDVNGRHFELIPFGSGRRICPGMPLANRTVNLMVGSLIHGFKWKLEDGVSAETLNMDDKFGLSLTMAQPIRAIPISVSYK